MNHLDVGIIGENLACEWLTNHGFRIMTRNFRTNIGEVDIICVSKACLVFVEVKARLTETFGKPYESVSKTKLRKIARAGTLYVERNHLQNYPMRIDIISIVLNYRYDIVEFLHLDDVLQ